MDVDCNSLIRPKHLHDEEMVPEFLKKPLLNRLEECAKKVRAHYKGWSSLRHKKKYKAVMAIEEKMDVAHGFIGFFVDLMVTYRKYIHEDPKNGNRFDSEAFIENKTRSLQPFLKQLVNSQLFQMFIEERIKRAQGTFDSELKVAETTHPVIAYSR